MTRVPRRLGVIGPTGSYFHVGDIIRNAETGEPMEVIVVSSDYIYFVRPRWYRRLRLWMRERV